MKQKFDDVVVYPVTNNLVDVFWGDGWTNQVRVKYEKGEATFRNAGKTIPARVLKIVKSFKVEKAK